MGSENNISLQNDTIKTFSYPLKSSVDKNPAKNFIFDWNNLGKNNNFKFPVEIPSKEEHRKDINKIITPYSIEYSQNISEKANLKTKYKKSYNVTTDLFTGTAADIDKYLENTPMKGLGKAFIDAQEKYGINAIFLMSIVGNESSYGAKPAEGTKYNVAGLKGKSGRYQQNSSFSASVDALGSVLNRLYINSSKKKLVTIEQIQSQFCTKDFKWTAKICEEMENISKSILDNRQ